MSAQNLFSLNEILKNSYVNILSDPRDFDALILIVEHDMYNTRLSYKPSFGSKITIEYPIFFYNDMILQEIKADIFGILESMSDY